MEDVKLLDLVPESAQIELNVNNTVKQYTLRAVNLSDEVWMQRTFGTGIEKVFSELQMANICKILFHQLEEKRDFAAVDEDGYDDDGNVVKVRLTGPEQIMRGISSKKHQIRAIESLCKTIGWSRPLLDEVEQKTIVDNKKKAPKKQKI